MTEFIIKKSTLTTDLARTSIFLHGLPKVGKTTFASCFRDKEGRPPLFLPTEHGYGALEVHPLDVNSWTDLWQRYNLISQHKEKIQKEYCAFVFDLISDMDQMCTEYICEQNHVRTLSDLEYGKGYALKKSEFQNLIRKFLAILPTVFISHSEEKEITVNGEKFKTQSPALEKNSFAYINGKVDTIMYLAPATSTREHPEIVCKGSMSCLAGSRFPQLVRNFRLFPEDMSRTFNQMQEVFSNEGRV